MIDFCDKKTPWKVGCYRAKGHSGVCRPYLDSEWERLGGAAERQPASTGGDETDTRQLENNEYSTVAAVASERKGVMPTETGKSNDTAEVCAESRNSTDRASVTPASSSRDGEAAQSVKGIIERAKRICACSHESYLHKLDGTCTKCSCVNAQMAWAQTEANYLQVVHPEPSSHVCGAIMVPTGHKCLSRGANTEPTMVHMPPKASESNSDISRKEVGPKSEINESGAVADKPLQPQSSELTEEQVRQAEEWSLRNRELWGRTVEMLAAYGAECSAPLKTRLEQAKKLQDLTTQNEVRWMQRAESAEADLRMIDGAFARRPALADYKTRYEMAYAACEMASKADAAQRKLNHLEQQLTTVRARVTQLEMWLNAAARE